LYLLKLASTQDLGFASPLLDARKYVSMENSSDPEIENANNQVIKSTLALMNLI
jgi:hypothetical protein